MQSGPGGIGAAEKEPGCRRRKVLARTARMRLCVECLRMVVCRVLACRSVSGFTIDEELAPASSARAGGAGGAAGDAPLPGPGAREGWSYR